MTLASLVEKSRLRFVVCGLLGTALLGGCTSTPPASFYTLRRPATAPAPGAPEQAAYRVTVGPLTLPDIVDRPQMVVRVATHEVALLDQHRWAEPLKAEIPRVIAGQLSMLLEDADVGIHPLDAGKGDAYRVRVDIQRFESLPGEGAVLEAYWSVSGGGERAMIPRRSLVRVAARGGSQAALAEAHGRALETMSQQIAETIQTQTQTRRRSP